METRYNLRFTGQLKASFTPQQAVAEVASVFKLSPDAVSELILGGKPRVIRRDVDRQTADRLVDVLGKAGLEVRIVPIQEQTTEPTSESMSMSEPVSEPLPVQGQGPARVQVSGQTSSKSAGDGCPRCGSSRVEAGSCLVCGVSLDQFRIHQAVSSGLSSVVEAKPATHSATGNADARSRSPSLGRRDRALKHAIANPRRRGGRVPFYALGVGLVALMVALQPESPPPSADAVDGALLSGSAPNGSPTSTGRAGWGGEQAAQPGSPTASAAAVAQARSVTNQGDPAATQPIVPSGQMPALLKAVQDAQATATAAAASPQPASPEPLDELPPDIRALYEAQQSRQSLGTALQAFQGKGSESGTP